MTFRHTVWGMKAQGSKGKGHIECGHILITSGCLASSDILEFSPCQHLSMAVIITPGYRQEWKKINFISIDAYNVMSEIADDFQAIQTCNSMYAYFFIKPFYNKGFLQTSHFMDNSFLIK